MRNILLVVAVLLAAFAWHTKQEQTRAKNVREYQRRLAEQAQNPGQPVRDSCTNKKFCAVVYVAPWCPACKQLAPQLRAALPRVKEKEFGLKIVVGQGRPEENDDEAASFGEAGSADQDGSIHKILGVSQYPSFFVLDQEKTVILANEEAFQWLNEKLR